MNTETSLTPDLLRRIDLTGVPLIIWRSGQIYLFDNPLLREPLQVKHIKPRLLGHWGTTPGQNFIYAHLNRVIKQYDPGYGLCVWSGTCGPAVVANVYLEGTYSEVYPAITQNGRRHEKAV